MCVCVCVHACVRVCVCVYIAYHSCFASNGYYYFSCGHWSDLAHSLFGSLSPVIRYNVGCGEKSVPDSEIMPLTIKTPVIK